MSASLKRIAWNDAIGLPNCTRSCAYAKERQQFGKPISKFQAIQFKLADMATEIEAGRALVYKAAWLKDQGRDFAREAAISRLYRDQKILEIGEGTNEVQRMVIARHLGL